ncbi:MAG: hypothetical protein DDT36_01678 [Firmicutes bacterium]|nr:hypothetical protein [Bacillota bacterium]
MEKYSGRILYKVTATLPYPLRLEGGPYNIVGNLGKAELSFETIRQTTYDTRLLIEGGDFDFKIDRYGWASYSRVLGYITQNHSVHPVATLVECLNQLIQNLRDMMSCFWLHDLEKVDLYQVSVESERERTEIGSWGRTGGITLPCTGVTTETEERLRHRLASREQVLQWRRLQLDAEDAFDLGRYEEAVLLGWGALEAACRTEIPRLARAAGVSAAELARRVAGKAPKRHPFSPEEVAEYPYVRDLVRVCCELAGTGYDPGSLAESARNAQRLRNVVTHRGIRLSRSQARPALDTIAFVLNVLRLPISRPPEPFDYQSWAEHFGKASFDFPQLLGTNEGRLVVVRIRHENPPDPLSYWFQLERANNSFIVRLPEEVDEDVAAALVVVTNDSFRYGDGQFPHLTIRESPFLMRGLLEEAARTATQSVHWAHAGMVRAQAGLPVQLACDYAVNSIWKGFTRLDHTIDSGDARFLPLCTRIASYLVHASAEAFQRFRQGMARSHRQISDEAVQVKNILTALDPGDPHSMCDALRTIHHRTTWLDSIVVRCPLEHAEYGTGKRRLQ